MLRLQNDYRATIWAMIEWRHPGCPDGGDWEKKGWWQIEPGQSAVAFGGDLDDVNRYWYYFAEAADGAAWAGPFQEWVPSTAFQWCKNTSSSQARLVGMRQLDIGDSEDHTLRFIA